MYKKQEVIEAMRQLIRHSCQSEHDFYNSFHKSLLKFNFNAVAVSIDKEGKAIFLVNSLAVPQTQENLYKLNESYTLRVSFSNFEETLKGCLNGRDASIRFYKSLLFKYNRVNQKVESA